MNMKKMNIRFIRMFTACIVAFFFSAKVNGQVVIQRCNNTTGWESAAPLTIDNTDKKEGTGSLKIEAPSGNNPWFYKSFTHTHTGITSAGYLSFWLYVSDATKMDGGQIEVSSSGTSDEREFNWPLSKDNVSDGWNLMQLKISSADQAGGGADLDKINFFRIYQDLSASITVKIDFIKFIPSIEKPVWPVLDVPMVDNSSLDGKVMFGYQGWFNHPDDGADIGWVHWGYLYEPIRSTVDMYPDLREFGTDEKYPSHYTLPDGSTAPVFSSYNRNTCLRHMKWVRDYNLDGVFIQRFISSYDNEDVMAHKDGMTKNIMEGCEKYGRVFAMMYDGIGGQVEEMKADWMHLVDDIGVTSSDSYLHHNGLPLVSMWGYTKRDEATLEQLNEMIEFFTNNPEPKYRASVKLGVTSSWYDKADWLNLFKQVDVISPWWSGDTDYNRGQKWCDDNDVFYLPVVHPGFSWYNLTQNSSSHHNSPDLNKDPRNGGKYFWDEVNDVVSVNAKSVYVAMFDEVDEGTAMFKLSENESMTPREGSL